MPEVEAIQPAGCSAASLFLKNTRAVLVFVSWVAPSAMPHLAGPEGMRLTTIAPAAAAAEHRH